ncbi:5-formyltetrahydrofolate cyclo-ligase [Thermodesulfatator atlanticus]
MVQDISNYKKTLRKKILAKRNALSKERRKEFSEKIKNYLLKSPYYLKSQKILFYASFGSEVETFEMIKEALAQGKEVYLPKTYVSQKKLRLFRVNSLKELKKGAYGILEPEEEKQEISPEELDLIILPGVAFDKKGGRLGYGGGFYDRLLEQAPQAIKVALGFGCQLCDELPLEAHDVPADVIITEEGLHEIF